MSKKNGAAPEPMATFDFTGVNRKWSKQWVRTLTRVGELELQMTGLQNAPDVPSDPQTAHERAQVQFQIIQDFEQVGADQEALLAEVLVNVPREWLSQDAPEQLDWHDPNSLDYVLETKYALLIRELQAARQSNSKN